MHLDYTEVDFASMERGEYYVCAWHDERVLGFLVVDPDNPHVAVWDLEEILKNYHPDIWYFITGPIKREEVKK